MRLQRSSAHATAAEATSARPGGGTRRRPRGPTRRGVVVRLASALVAALASGGARAHAILVESRPGAGATVAAGTAAVALRFNCRIDHARSRLVLQGGHEGPTRLTIDPASAADTLAARVRLDPGDYTLRWQVLAVDGHITRGDVRFTVA